MLNMDELVWINEDSRVVIALKTAEGIRKAAVAKKSEGGTRTFDFESLNEALEVLGCPAKRIAEITYIENSSRYSFGVVNTHYERRQRIVRAMAENQFLGANSIDEREHIISSRLVEEDGETARHIVCALETVGIASAFEISKRHKMKMSGIYAGIDAGICAYMNRGFGGEGSLGVIALDCGYSYAVAVMHHSRPLEAFRAKKSEYARAAERIKEVISSCARRTLDDFVVLSNEGDYFAEHVIRGAGIKTDNLIISGEVQEYILEGIFMG